MRNNALEHLECAALNGFNRNSVGCEIIISDGLRGDDETDHLHAINPTSDWELCIKHAEELGAGTRAYELVEVK